MATHKFPITSLSKLTLLTNFVLKASFTKYDYKKKITKQLKSNLKLTGRSRSHGVHLTVNPSIWSQSQANKTPNLTLPTN